MKKWKQLVVFVMILTMVMGMTSFATDATSTSGAQRAGVARATDGDEDVPEPTVVEPGDEDQNEPGDDQDEPGDDNQGSGNGSTTNPTTPTPNPSSGDDTTNPGEDNKGDDSTSTPSTDDNATGEIVDVQPSASLANDTVLVNGKEEKVELVSQQLSRKYTSDDIAWFENQLKAEAAKLTGFKETSKKKTFLFDLDLVIRGTRTSVGSDLQQIVEVSISCAGMGLPAGTTKDNLRVLHYNEKAKAWEKRTVISYENGVLTAEFDSFSPVAIIWADEAVADTVDDRLTSTKDAWKLTSGIVRNKYNVIVLKWNALGVKGSKYELGFFNTSTDTNPYKIVSTKKTTYKFSKAVCGKEYYFKVRVKGTSTWSDVCYAATTLSGKGAPVITAVKTTYNTVTIRWKKVTGAKSYAIYNSLDATTPVATVKGTKITFKNAVAGQTYTYYVRPVRDNSIGDASAPAVATPTLDSVKSVKVKGLDSQTVKVTWRKVKGATSYIVEQWNPMTSSYEYLGEVKAPSTNATVYELSHNATYKFRVIPVRGTCRGGAGEGQGKTKNIPN